MVKKDKEPAKDKGDESSPRPPTQKDIWHMKTSVAGAPMSLWQYLVSPQFHDLTRNGWTVGRAMEARANAADTVTVDSLVYDSSGPVKFVSQFSLELAPNALNPEPGGGGGGGRLPIVVGCANYTTRTVTSNSLDFAFQVSDKGELYAREGGQLKKSLGTAGPGTVLGFEVVEGGTTGRKEAEGGQPQQPPQPQPQQQQQQRPPQQIQQQQQQQQQPQHPTPALVEKQQPQQSEGSSLIGWASLLQPSSPYLAPAPSPAPAAPTPLFGVEWAQSWGGGHAPGRQGGANGFGGGLLLCGAEDLTTRADAAEGDAQLDAEFAAQLEDLLLPFRYSYHQPL
eukprot:TRINITY_DN5460_c0_g1_i2.p1 TRINITY_DN5460_c0_g1~~TRINITY_DN5460_c0_g1_i2.p1  ORF type:complete len:338 (-),score=66.61 TRINITY_DN5460_c0_g1_i2:174-1187(-)